MRFAWTRQLVWLFLLSSCTPVPARDPLTLVWNMGGEPDTLNPLTATDVYASRVDSLLFDTLIERDNETLVWKPKMAQSWTISADHREFVFQIREGIRWHDGQPVTVEDILYSFERIMDPAVDSPHLRVYYRDVSKVEKVGERAVRFTYRTPYFMALEFCGTMPILPKHLFDNGEDFNSHSRNRAPIGNGPYRFVRWETGKRIIVEKNPDYWARGTAREPQIRRISLEVIAEDAVAFQVLKKGEIDYAGMRPIQWVRQTSSEKFTRRFEKYQFHTPSYSFIGWNLRRPIFADRSVRQALTRLVNREEILNKLNFGLGRVVTGPFYIETEANDPNLTSIPYDPVEARRLLKSAGWADHDGDGLLDRKGQPFQFTFLTSAGSQFAERLATILKEDLRKVGIAMEIRKVEWALFTKYLDDRNFDAVTLGWSMGIEQDPYQIWHSSQVEKGSNFVGYSDPDADRIIETARAEFDPERRNLLYRKLHRMIYEEQPYTFLYSSPNLVALHRRFGNVRVYPTGMDPLEWRVETPVMEEVH